MLFCFIAPNTKPTGGVLIEICSIIKTATYLLADQGFACTFLHLKIVEFQSSEIIYEKLCQKHPQSFCRL